MIRPPVLWFYSVMSIVIYVSPCLGEDDNPTLIKGGIGLFAKHNSNIKLIDEETTGLDKKDAFISEAKGELSVSKPWSKYWWSDLNLASYTNLHAQHASENWYLNQGQLSIGWDSGKHTIYAESGIRYFTGPDSGQDDFYRHTSILSYSRKFSRLWQLRTGYQNVITRYPRGRLLDYNVNGIFIESRSAWRPALITYYSIDLQQYKGTADPEDGNPNAAPHDGQRQTLRIGLDWNWSTRHILSCAYMFQNDTSEFIVRQIGVSEGSEHSQDNDAEFDLRKQKITLLYAYHYNSRLSLSFYEEWILKNWDDNVEGIIPVQARTDHLFLSSTFLKYKWRENLHIKLRYLFRANDSTIGIEDYANHIVSIGPEIRF